MLFGLFDGTVRIHIADLQHGIAIHTSRPHSSLPTTPITIDLETSKIEEKRQKCHLMCLKFCHNHKYQNEKYADDKKWRIGYSALEFVENAERQDHSNDDNAYLTQAELEDDGILVFYLDRDFILHDSILPYIAKECKSLYFSKKCTD